MEHENVHIVIDKSTDVADLMIMFNNAGMQDIESKVIRTILEMKQAFENKLIYQTFLMTKHAKRSMIAREDVEFAINKNKTKNHLNLASRNIIDYHKRIDSKTLLFKPYLDMRKHLQSVQVPNYQVKPEFNYTAVQNNFKIDKSIYQKSDIERKQNDLRHQVQLQPEAKLNVNIRPVIIQPKQVIQSQQQPRPRFKIIAQPNTSQ